MRAAREVRSTSTTRSRCRRSSETAARHAVPSIARLDPADDAAAGAERDHRRLRAARPIDDRGHFGFIPRKGDDIGSIVVTAREPPRIVRERLAVGMGRPVIGFARAMRREGRRRHDPRRPQPDFGKRGGAASSNRSTPNRRR